ncbi:hypothetical protein NMY22_g19498 [Coprinellus aureogranulatus]|nr:hypothetical protein NMY22_g19498 [Coprinellus aureogranulatus]
MDACINDHLSLDVLLRIFDWAVFLDNTTSVRSRCVVRSTRSPLLLSWVCRYWRSLTISTPTLWSNLEMETSRLICRDAAKKIYGLWMERTSPYSLALFVFEDYYSDAQLAEHPGVAEFIAKCAARCKYLYLSGPQVCEGVLKQLACLNDAIFPYLEGLYLSSGCFHSLKLDYAVSRIQFPNLRQLGVCGTDHGDIDHMRYLYNPLTTHLSCDGYLLERLLASRPGTDFNDLTELDVTLFSLSDDRNYPVPPPPQFNSLDLPQLKILTVSENYLLDRTASFLGSISSPALSVLKIQGSPLIPCDFLEPSQDLTFLEDFVSQTPLLKRLELSHNLFHCDNFLTPHSKLYQIPFVQLSVTVRIRPWADCWTYHGERYKKKGLEVAYEMSQGGTGPGQLVLTMLVGWSKEKEKGGPEVGLGKRDVSAWKTSFWAGEAGKDHRRRRNQTLVRF